MDTLKAIEKLAHKARGEEILRFDVADKVLVQIKSEEPEVISFIPFELFAGISTAAASVVAFLSINAWHYITNPMIEFLTPLKEVPLW
jgi:hypothetical protein